MEVSSKSERCHLDSEFEGDDWNQRISLAFHHRKLPMQQHSEKLTIQETSAEPSTSLAADPALSLKLLSQLSAVVAAIVSRGGRCIS